MEIRKNPGRIITFYSYKGGTGRSMALANVAWLLAAAGRRVLIVDWDLEAPGLHRYVHPFLDDPDLTSSEGVIDFVISYTEEASSKKLDEKLDPKWFAPYANITRFATPLDYIFPNGGSLDFIPAGKQGPAYAGRVNSFNWREFYSHLGGGAVLEEASARMRDYYDFILIDSRTGVSDTSGICTMQMPDDVVICFTLNMQSVSGAAAVARSMQEQRRKNPLQLFPVAMRVEFGEQVKIGASREYAKEKFLNLMSDTAVEPPVRDKYWHEVEVPQIPFYAFEEQMAYFIDSPNQVTGVLASMKRLVWWLTKVDVRTVPDPEPAIRKLVLAKYAAVWSGGIQITAPELSKPFVYVSYNEYTASVARAANPSPAAAFGLPGDIVPAGAEVITATELPRTGSWIEAFRAVLRRSVAMFLVIDEHGVSPLQQREVAVALDHRARVAHSAEFPITAVPLPGSVLQPYPGLAAVSGESCPYPGLRPFDPEDAAVFFGHEVFLERLLEQMSTVSVIALCGGPGTGKTSAIMAGLIPKLFLQDAQGSTWKVAVCHLAGDPLAGIAEALVRAWGVAQFEGQVRQETSALVARLPKEGAGAFNDVVSSVLSAWPAADRIAVVIEAGAAKLDPQYFQRMFRAIPAMCFIILSELPDATSVALPPLSRDDLIRAIEQPALRTGSELESGLAARIAADLKGQDHSLALLQFCMVRLWERRVNRMIPAADYEMIGGVQGAVTTWAESILGPLSAQEQELAVQLMCRMVGIADDGTYQPRPVRSDVITEALRETVTKLVHDGLLTVGPTDRSDVYAYSLFHLPLALRWPRLQEAVTHNADFLRWRDVFQSTVEEYALRQSYSALLRGEALATALKWLVDRPDELTQREKEFIHRSADEARRVVKSATPRPLRIGMLVAGLILALVAALVFYYFNSQRADPKPRTPYKSTSKRAYDKIRPRECTAYDQAHPLYSAVYDDHGHLFLSLNLSPFVGV